MNIIASFIRKLFNNSISNVTYKNTNGDYKQYVKHSDSNKLEQINSTYTDFHPFTDLVNKSTK